MMRGLAVACIASTVYSQAIPKINTVNGTIVLQSGEGGSVHVNGNDLMALFARVNVLENAFDQSLAEVLSVREDITAELNAAIAGLTVAPTGSPVTSQPTTSPTTSIPSAAPSVSPTTLSPTMSPTLGVSTGTLWRNPGTYTFAVPTNGTYKIWLAGGGGGGSNNGNRGGHGGLIGYEIPLFQGETITVGVGARGRYSTTSDGPGNYPMRGGNHGYRSGSGGCGSFIRVSSAQGRAHWNNYVAVAGGGGGSANHGFTANYGGHGFGAGGAAYSSNYAETGRGGKSGFNGNNGRGGDAQSGGRTGGSASRSGGLNGGNGGYNTYAGGGGGGGAGGGGGGASGRANPATGGYVSSSRSVGGFPTDVVARGGGGGGSHGNNCGGTGGGGGALAFTAYRTTLAGTLREGSTIPYYRNSIGSSRTSQYRGYSTLRDHTRTVYNTDILASLVSNRGTGGSRNGNGYHGFVFISQHNQNRGNIRTIN